MNKAMLLQLFNAYLVVVDNYQGTLEQFNEEADDLFEAASPVCTQLEHAYFDAWCAVTLPNIVKVLPTTMEEAREMVRNIISFVEASE
jgi:hypothetical protein